MSAANLFLVIALGLVALCAVACAVVVLCGATADREHEIEEPDNQFGAVKQRWH